MTENRIRVGILGCAGIARRSLAPAFLSHPAFDLVAVASRTAEKAAAFVARLESPEGGIRTSDYDSLVSSPDVDLVYCPLPTGLHYEWVKKCLTAGKHVLCEKSLACRYAEAQDLVRTARERHRFLMESFQFRFHAQNLYVKELLAKNAIGRLRQLVVRFGIPPFPEGAGNIRYSAALGGGALLDNGAYTLKCATYLLGPDVTVLAAMQGDADPRLGDVPLTGSIMLSAVPPHCPPLDSRHAVCVQTAYGFDHFYQNGYEIWGRDGRISTIRAFTAREDFAAPVVLETASGRVVKTFNDDHFARLLDYIAQSLADGDRCEREYGECLIQAKLLEETARASRRGWD